VTAPAPYVLLDSGGGRKLERVGSVVLDRQAPAAFWSRRLDAATWRAADAHHVRSETGGGRWEERRPLPREWDVSHGGFVLRAKATPFGHLGFFAEQAGQWTWIEETARALTATRSAPPNILNLFAYTGGSSLAAARGGAHVCHVDAAKGVVDWARDHARMNGLDDRPIRWIVDDALEFLDREARRGRRYDGAIFDPPSFGRGAKGQVWKIEDAAQDLLLRLKAALTPKPDLLLFSCHTPGFTPIVLKTLLSEAFDLRDAEIEAGEMHVPESGSDRLLPAGAFARARRP
jgi:23S rRNA (cytosine1962-C5)-methyltransferase